MDQTVEKLRNKFNSQFAAADFDPKRADELFELLIDAYCEPQRHYHTPSHLAHMFAKQDEAQLDDTACHWATWFHDVVYEPGKSDNETKSAEVATHHLTRLGMRPPLTSRIVELIRLTQNHDCRQDDRIAHLFLDSDMSILGEDSESYAHYLTGVRQEFSNIPRFLFRRGRRAFLKDLLKRDHIFLSEYFRNNYEASARRNISEELKDLS